MNFKKPVIVGRINKRVIELLDLNEIEPGLPILLGESNIQHMQASHPYDYEKYRKYLSEILSNPTYVAKHPKKDSIEYIKVFQ
jgi:hypothetical protein